MRVTMASERALDRRASQALDERSVVAKQLAAYQAALVSALGGEDALSTQMRAIS
jgi:hypothetical protein